MAHKALIDNDIHGWREEDEDRIRKKYTEIIHVGSVDELPPESKDEKIGCYCYENCFDLFTADKTAHVKFFRDARIKQVIIENWDIYETGNRRIYLVKII